MHSVSLNNSYQVKRIPNLARRSGFTLIELMIVVVIAGILAAVAYPSYRNQVVKGNRAAAQSYMMSLSGREEQLMLDRRQYVPATDNAALGSTAGLLAVPGEVSKYYNVSIAADNSTTPPAFVISAAPIAGTMQASDPTLTLNSAGTKGPSGYW